MIANIIYFARLSDGATLTSTEISSMIWISAIILAGAFALVIWAIYLVVKCSKKTFSCDKDGHVSKTSQEETRSQRMQREHGEQLTRRDNQGRFRKSDDVPQALEALQRQGRS